MRSNRSCASTMVLVAAMVILAACGASPSVLRWPPAPPLVPPSARWQAPATALLCRVADSADGFRAVYYLAIHSAAFDFSPCNFGVARIRIHWDDTQSTVDNGVRQRCLYGAATDDSVNGYVNILSTAEPINVVAGNRLCTAHHGVPR